MLRIGELAEACAVGTKTIRYYESIGLLPPPPRSENGYRRYDGAAVLRLRFIAKAKGLGLRLDEIREILSLHDRGESPCDRVLNLTKEKISWVDEQIRGLQLFRSDLQQLWHEAQESRTQTRDCVCSLIEDHSTAQEAPYPRQKLKR